MKILVKQVAPDVFSLSFDGTTVALDGSEVKTLLVQITTVMAPGLVGKLSPAMTFADLVRHLKSANDVGVQSLIRAVDGEDVLILLKLYDDAALHEKLLANMSERSAKMYREDLIYQFKDGVPDAKRKSALGHLTKAASRLVDEEVLVYENIKTRKTTPNVK